MFEAVREAILQATEEAHAKGWAGADLQAHIFTAAFKAAADAPEEAQEDEPAAAEQEPQS